MFHLKKTWHLGSEDEMVKNFIKLFKKEKIDFGSKHIRGKYYEQIRVPQIKRISDLIIRFEDSRLVNLEFKLKDLKCVYNQATDHLIWADYSYVVIPSWMLTQMPKDYFKKLKSKGIGLVVGTNDTFIELFRAKHNTYKNGKNKLIRESVLKKIKSKTAL